MKTMRTVLITLLAGVSLAAGTTDERVVETTPQRAERPRAEPKTETYQRVHADGVTVSGIAVAAVRADNKLQLLNPLAPDEYGSSEDNVVRDPIHGKVTGLKILSIEF
jgi:hypothetical protein